MLRLNSDLFLSVVYEDKSPFGHPLRERADAFARAAFRPVYEYVQEYGTGDLGRVRGRLLGAVLRSSAFRSAAITADANGWTLRPEVLHPPRGLTRPALLTVGLTPEQPALALEARAGTWRTLHRLFAMLSGPGLGGNHALPRDQRTVLNAMIDRGLVGPADGDPRGQLSKANAVFVGHNTVVLRSKTHTVITDPLLLPCGAADRDYRPLGIAQLGKIDAVLITHSHVDHFHPGSLLQLPADTQMIVPHVEAESVLAIDMAARLRELGFDRVYRLKWGHSLAIGDIRVHALPFFGEQPSTGKRLHPEIRNTGNVYYVATPDLRVVFLADSGRDEAGDMLRDVAPRIRSLGPPDLMFAGYRSVRLMPAELLASDLARFFYFVLPDRWAVPDQLMTSSAEAIAIAEAAGARYVVPYAAGGAPWHWRIGLGPRLDDPQSESPATNPFPEQLVIESRHSGKGITEPLLLRPGDGLRVVRDAIERVRIEGHAWPFRPALD